MSIKRLGVHNWRPRLANYEQRIQKKEELVKKKSQNVTDIFFKGSFVKSMRIINENTFD
jgi:hypothetical protein